MSISLSYFVKVIITQRKLFVNKNTCKEHDKFTLQAMCIKRLIYFNNSDDIINLRNLLNQLVACVLRCVNECTCVVAS